MVGGLVGEVVPEHSCLVFCPTKRNCETLAELICRILPKELTKVKYFKVIFLNIYFIKILCEMKFQ